MHRQVFGRYPHPFGFYDVQAKDLAKLPPEVRLIDVRTSEEYTGDLGHLERAELVPLNTLAEAMRNWNKEDPILMICRSGNRSGQAAQALHRIGFTQVANLVGGMMAVRAEGRG